MSTIQANLIEPSSGTTVTLGASGDTVAVGSGATASGFSGGLDSVQTFTSSGTWTRPSGITKVIMEVQGAGGSGSEFGNHDYATAGSGGGYAKKLLDVSSISSSTITVGAGGAAATTGAGSNGGLSSWADGTNTITGNGGTGGGTSVANTSIVGGSASGGDINITGAHGSGGSQGDGASHGSMFGFGTRRAWTGENQNPDAVGYGGGGAAGKDATSGAGGGGIVIVWEYK